MHPESTHGKRLNAEGKQTGAFAIIHIAIDDITSEVSQGECSIETPGHGESVTTTKKNIDNTEDIDGSANEQPCTPPAGGPYALHVQWNDGVYEVASFSCKETYRVQISVGISSSSILNVANLVDKGAGPNNVNEDILQPAWNK